MSRSFSSATLRLLQHPAIQVLCIILSGAAAYSNTFHVPFLFDDFHAIVENRSLDSLSTFLASDVFPNPRWVALATFALNKGLGGLDVAGFHAVNLAIHLANGLVVYFLAKATTSSFDETASRRYGAAPIIAALAFVLHPVQTQSVTYIVQRMTSLATLLYLAALLLYALNFLRVSASTSSFDPLRYLLYPAAFISCLLAMGTKEISFSLPAMLALFDVSFLRGTVRQRFLRLAPFALCMLVMPVFLFGLERGFDTFTHGGGDESSFPLPWMTYLLTEFRVLITYLRLLVLPVAQNLDYDYPVYTSIFQPQVVGSLAAIVAISTGGIYLLKSSFRPSCLSPALLRVCGFAIAWFFITISIESGFVPLIDTIFEHRVYLPSSWFMIAFGMLGCELYHRAGTARQAVLLAAISLLCISGYATYQRNQVWSDRLTLWSDVVAKSPMKARGWTELGILYVNRLDPARAIPLLERAVNLNPDYYLAQVWLGRALVQNGERDRALYHYIVTTRLAPGFSQGWELAGRLLLEKGQAGEAVYYLGRAQELDPEGFVSQGHLQRALKLETHVLK